MASASVTYSFTAGTAAVAANVNTNFTDLVSFLNNQVVHKDGTVSMTGALTLPGNPSSALQAATKQYVDALAGAPWTGFTPTLTQSGAVSKTVDYAEYVQLGKLVVGNVRLTCTGSGTLGTSVLAGLPVAATATTGGILAPGTVVGSGIIWDNDGLNGFDTTVHLRSSTSVGFRHTDSSVWTGDWGSGIPIALQVNDRVTYSFVYETT